MGQFLLKDEKTRGILGLGTHDFIATTLNNDKQKLPIDLSDFSQNNIRNERHHIQLGRERVRQRTRGSIERTRDRLHTSHMGISLGSPIDNIDQLKKLMLQMRNKG